MFGLGPWELIIILVIALVVLGPKKLPEVARSIGKGLREIRRASNDLRSHLELDELDDIGRLEPGGEEPAHKAYYTQDTGETQLEKSKDDETSTDSIASADSEPPTEPTSKDDEASPDSDASGESAETPLKSSKQDDLAG